MCAGSTPGPVCRRPSGPVALWTSGVPKGDHVGANAYELPEVSERRDVPQRGEGAANPRQGGSQPEVRRVVDESPVVLVVHVFPLDVLVARLLGHAVARPRVLLVVEDLQDLAVSDDGRREIEIP